MSTPCQIIIVMEGGGNGRIRHLWLQLTSFLKQTFFNVCETWMMGPGQSVCFRLTTWKMTWNSACTRLFAEMVHTGTASRYVCIPVKRPDEVHPNMFKPPFFCRGDNFAFRKTLRAGRTPTVCIRSIARSINQVFTHSRVLSYPVCLSKGLSWGKSLSGSF